VGSGKTVVAAIAALNVALSGNQTAVMAPTEILARQHFETFKVLFAPTQYTVVLWTNAYKISCRHGKEIVCDGKKEIIALQDEIADKQTAIVIGTHALIEEQMRFGSLALAAIDEQHRFGVRMRKLLCEKSGVPGTEPHLLSMTATPIPRSLALTLFGDLELSLLLEKPKGRQRITTRVVQFNERDATFERIREQIADGRQVFIVCPTIDASDALGVASVTEEYKKLRSGEFRGIPIAMLHGKMPADAKEKVMEEFRKGKTKALVATSVIEVGIDVPNASIMCVFGAERFGLAQLHQFRGRVGRGEYASQCFLFPTDASIANERLSALAETDDGFALAEKDLALRGPGEMLGVAQSGYGGFKIASLADVALIKESREAAQKVLQNDPDFIMNPSLRDFVGVREKEAHLE
jgi:ATP-dependent DNA helicase RecG